MKMSTLPVRGTKDYLPKEVEVRDYLRTKIENTYKKFGFNKINTPAMEDIERLNKSDGGENLAMIFKLLKRGQKLDLSSPDLNENDLVDSGLRYDLTMPLSRYYANNRHLLPTPFKALQIDKVFRAERPQKGRLREFYQCDIDIIGDASINAEMELIAATTSALKAIGFSDFTVRIDERRILTDMILAAGFSQEDIASVCISFDKLDKIGLDGVKSELLEKEYAPATVEKFMQILSAADNDALATAEKYCSNPDVIANLQKVLAFSNSISEGNFTTVYDKSLVRGMGYYTGMVFEIVSPKFGSSIAGGGRYDGMIGKFVGESVPAVGFSIGFERISAIFMEENFVPPAKEKLVLAYEDTDNFADVVLKAKSLQAQDKIVIMLKRSKKFGKQLDMLIAEGAKLLINFADGSSKVLS
ncbi:MAG: histidine--tRNA ligase [Alphaproteobacteria bacterium]|nr:histidine--tRNA ligase [Alphaproteobacteria bacterium]